MRVADSENEVENSRRHLALTSGLQMQAHMTCTHAKYIYIAHKKNPRKIVTAFSFKFGKSLNVKNVILIVYFSL